MLHITCVMTTSSKTQLIPTKSLQSKRLLRSVHMSHASWRTCHQVTHMDSHWHSRVCVLSACTKGIIKICTFYVNATQCTHFVSRSSTKRSTWPTPGPSHQYLVSFNKPQAWLWGGSRLSETPWHKKQVSTTWANHKGSSNSTKCNEAKSQSKTSFQLWPNQEISSHHADTWTRRGLL